MDEIEVDFREVAGLADDLRQLQRGGFMRDVKQVVSRGCLQIKNDWKERWEGHPHIPQLPRAISYDVVGRGLAVYGEVGPDKNKPQGPLGNIIEFGTVHNSPIPGGVPALEEEEPKFVKALADLGEEAPLDHGPR